MSKMPSVDASSAKVSSGTWRSMDRTISAVLPVRDGPTAIDEMDTPAVTEGGADHADHSRPVVVADHEHVLGRRDLDGVVVDHDDAGLGPWARQRARQRVLGRAQRDEVDVVA